MRLQHPALWVPGSGFKTLLMDDSFPAKPPAMRARCVVVVWMLIGGGACVLHMCQGRLIASRISVCLVVEWFCDR